MTYQTSSVVRQVVCNRVVYSLCLLLLLSGAVTLRAGTRLQPSPSLSQDPGDSENPVEDDASPRERIALGIEDVARVDSSVNGLGQKNDNSAHQDEHSQESEKRRFRSRRARGCSNSDGMDLGNGGDSRNDLIATSPSYTLAARYYTQNNRIAPALTLSNNGTKVLSVQPVLYPTAGVTATTP